MFNGMSTMEIIKVLSPLIAIQVVLMVFCLIKLSKDRVKFFPKLVWLVIIVIINTIGPLLYLLVGRERD
jgi:hypothetical protein